MIDCPDDFWSGRSLALDPMVDHVAASGEVIRLAFSLAELGAQVRLVGPAASLPTHLATLGPAPSGLSLHDAGDAPGLHEDPGVVRGRPQASVRVALDLLAAGAVRAVASAGSRDVALTAAHFTLGRVKPTGHVLNDSRARVQAAAKPGFSQSMTIDGRTIVVARPAAADRVTAMDLVGRMLQVAGPGDRLGVLDPLGLAKGLMADAAAIGQEIDRAILRVTVPELLHGAVDVVGCTADIGEVLLQSLMHGRSGEVLMSLTSITGVIGRVASITATTTEGELRAWMAGS